MEALKRSIAGTPKPADVIKTKKPRKKLEGQREMLLPVSGSKAKAPAAAATALAKKASKSSTGRKAG
jgi:DNA end-binding protein Ku